LVFIFFSWFFFSIRLSQFFLFIYCYCCYLKLYYLNCQLKLMSFKYFFSNIFFLYWIFFFFLSDSRGGRLPKSRSDANILQAFLYFHGGQIQVTGICKFREVGVQEKFLSLRCKNETLILYDIYKKIISINK